MSTISTWRRFGAWLLPACLAAVAPIGSCGCPTNNTIGGGDSGGGGQDAGGGGQDGSSQDSGNVGHDGATGYDGGIYTYDSGQVVEELCPIASQKPAQCQGELVEGSNNLCDGLDNDCDGNIDEGCPCMPGAVQRCFRGPPGHRNIGACSDGQQLCEMQGEAGGTWGACEGGISPRGEVCDDLDNDCNGCSDEVEGCVQPQGTCPAPGDLRTPDGRPFTNYQLRGGDFFPGANAVAWHWNVAGTPCDKMFQALPGSTATAANGQLSFTLHNPDNREASIDFTLSGDYVVTMEVTLNGGDQFSCTWVIHVRAPGLRVELCWDVTGPTSVSAGGPIDVDLHLGKTGTTTQWFTANDCYWTTCRGQNGIWGYTNTAISNCTGPGSLGGFAGSCPNPRLDMDNVDIVARYLPENINIDVPGDGDQFRVMVHHWTTADRAAHPLVNIYCGGELKGTYGAAPDLVEGFDQGGMASGGSMWRVADVTTQVNSSGNTTGCVLTPLRNASGTSYHVTNDDSAF